MLSMSSRSAVRQPQLAVAAVPRRAWRPSRAFVIVLTVLAMLASLMDFVPSLRGTAAYASGSAPGMPASWASLPAIAAAQSSTGTMPGSWNVSASGAFEYSIPIDVPAGRANMAPSLSLRYSSRGGDGIVGVGWELSGAVSTITRCPKSLSTEGKIVGVKFDSTDHFCMDGQKLIGVVGAYGGDASEYRTETDSFAMVQSSGVNPAGPDSFKVWTKDGHVLTYNVVTTVRSLSDVYFGASGFTNGNVTTSQPRVMWLLHSRADRSGNQIIYHYNVSSNASGIEVVPSEIDYTYNAAQPLGLKTRYVSFEYETRPDASFSFAGGVKYLRTQRLKTIKMFAPNPGATGVVWQYKLSYGTPDGRSALASVAKCGGTQVGCLHAKTFGWQSGQSWTTTDLGNYPTNVSSARAPYLHVTDLNGDGADDAVLTLGGKSDADSPDWAVLGKRDAATGAVSPLSDKVQLTGNMPDWPANVDLPRSRPFDMDSDGASEFAAEYTDGSGAHDKVLHWDSAAHKFVYAGTTIANPSETNFADMDGDGRLDWLTADIVQPQERDFSVRLNTGSGMGALLPSKFSQCPGGVRIVDVDGDGRAEMVGPQNTVSKNCSTITYAMHLDDNGNPTTDAVSYQDVNGWVHYRSLPPVSGSRAGITGDFNGDGLEDHLLIPLTQKLDWQGKFASWAYPQSLAWNTGNGLTADWHVPNIPHDEYADIRVADVNGDGKDDLISFYHAMKTPTNRYTSISISRGDGTFVTSFSTDDGTLDPDLGHSTSQVGDFNADGRPDYVRIVNGHLMLSTNTGSGGVRLNTVTDDGTWWAAQTVAYDTTWTDHQEKAGAYPCSYPVACPRRGITVVRRVDSRQHWVNPTASTKPYSLFYSYEAPMVDRRGRGMLGFGVMRVWDPQRPMETIRTFAQLNKQVEGKYYPFSTPTYVTRVVPILTQAQVNAAGPPTSAKARVSLSMYTDAWRHPEGFAGVYQTYEKSSYSEDWEQQVTLTWGSLVGTSAMQHIGGAAEPLQPDRRIDRSSTVDDYGNVTDRTTATTGGVTETRHTDFDYRLPWWLITLPVHETVTRAEHDNMPPPVTRTIDRHYDDLGRLDTAWVEKNNPDLDLRTTIAYGYDTLGVLRTTTVTAGDPANPALPPRVTHIEYDPVWAAQGQPDEEVFPSQVWSDHDQAAYRPSTWTAVHPAYGVPVATMDANGVQASTVYDDLGRPLHVNPPTGDATDITYADRADQGGGLNGLVVTSTTGQLSSQTIRDALGRPLTVSSSGFDGVLHGTTTAYDALGHVVSRTGPAPIGTSTFTYDSLDQLLESTSPDGKVAHNEYPSMFTTKSFDETGAETDSTVDVDGRVVMTTEHNTSVSPAQTIDTHYEYAPFNLVAKVTGDQGDITSYDYDSLGRRTKSIDPDRGTTYTLYFGTGEVRKQYHDGTYNGVTFDYDDLGRMITRSSGDGDTVFVYDTAAHGIGRLDHADSPDKIRVGYRYDQFGRQTGTDYTDLDPASPDYNVVRSMDNTFDNSGRPATLSYPAFYSNPGQRYTVTLGYNSHGYPNTVTNTTDPATPKPLWGAISRLDNGALQDAVLGNGNGAMTVHDNYYNLTGRLGLSTVTHGATTLQNLSYTYFDNGAVHTRSDSVAGRYETYGYDTTGRLTSWALSSRAVGAITTSYSYDNIGNLTWVSSPAGTEERDYAAGGPHTIDTNDSTVGNAGITTFTYDAQGRRVDTLDEGDNVLQHVVYNSFDLPKIITTKGVLTSYRYDAFGHKIVETTGANRTFYIPGYYEHRTSAGTESDVFYLHGTDGAIGQAVHTENTLTTEYTLIDKQGSTATTVDESGSATNHIYYDPFGGLVDAAGKPATLTGDVTHTYTGHEADTPTNLLNAGGRIYDPAQKVFLTPDPAISNPRDGQAYNPYSYVRNDPVNNTDPTGYIYEDGHSPASQQWWDSYEQSSFDEFVGAGDAYYNGGAAGLAQWEQGALGREEKEYYGHVRADQDEANQQAQETHDEEQAQAAEAKPEKSDDTGNQDDIAWEAANATAVDTEPTTDPVPGAGSDTDAVQCADETLTCDEQTADESDPGDLLNAKGMFGDLLTDQPDLRLADNVEIQELSVRVSVDGPNLFCAPNGCAALQNLVKTVMQAVRLPSRTDGEAPANPTVEQEAAAEKEHRDFWDGVGNGLSRTWNLVKNSVDWADGEPAPNR
jgi:RHS repeat-associated protein